MLTLREARALAEAQLAEWNHAELLVITGEQEFDIGWVFFYDTERHRRTGEVSDALAGDTPILIDRHTGEVLPAGTVHPIDHYVCGHSRNLQHPEAG